MPALPIKRHNTVHIVILRMIDSVVVCHFDSQNQFVETPSKDVLVTTEVVEKRYPCNNCFGHTPRYTLFYRDHLFCWGGGSLAYWDNPLTNGGSPVLRQKLPLPVTTATH